MRHDRSHYSEQFFLGICHRGLHNAEYSENGLKAFENAIKNNMAFECDVHLSKDGVLFVMHDSKLERMTGKEGTIEELDSKTIKENYRLPDGGEVPTLQEVLDLVQEKVLLVVELKIVNNNYKAVAKEAKRVLSQVKDPSKIAVISFDPRALLKMGKRYERQLLLVKEKDWVKRCRFLFESLDLDIRMVKEDWVQRYRKKGGIVNCWTVETEEQVKDLSPYVDAMTFQHVSKDIVIADRKAYLKSKE